MLLAAFFSIAAMGRIVSLSLASISPDASRIAFVASSIDPQHNRQDDTLEIYDRATGTLRAAAKGHRSVDALAWSPDGTRLAAVLDVPGESADQLYVIDPKSGAFRRLTFGKTGVNQLAWSPDGSRVAFTRRDEAPMATGAAAYRDGFEVTDNAYLVTKPPQPLHVWLVDMEARARRLTSGTWSVADSPISWSPDGRHLLFVRAPNAIYALQDRTSVMLLDVGSGRSIALTPHTRYEDNALFSPSGAHVAYRYNRGGDPMNQPDAVVDDRDVSVSLDRHVQTFSWMPDNASLLLQVSDRAQTPLYVQPLHGPARELPMGNVVDASIQPMGSVARDGTIALVGDQRTRPDELYVLRPGALGPERLTDFNGGIASLRLGRVERIVWSGPRGILEDGVLTYPPGYTPGRRYPMVLRIHGGPTESSTLAFEPFRQLAAAHGYLVFAPNYRGSNDLGDAYEHAIYNDASIGPGHDIMAGIRAIEHRGIVDSSRLAVSGWSYGGQLTSWMEAQYPIWRAAVAGAAVNDLVVDYAIADDIDADAASFAGGSPFRSDALRLWRKHSPITYYKNIRTPTLIFGNVYDVRVPIVESYEMFRALRDNGVPVKFIAYPTTGHLPNGPVRLADVYQRWLSWFDAHLQPKDPPKSPAVRCAPAIYAPAGRYTPSRLKSGPGLILSGAGFDGMPHKAVFAFMRSHFAASPGKRSGNVLILKASDGRYYSDGFYREGGFASVQEVLIPPCATRAQVDSIAPYARRADAVLFAGGDQAHYVVWKGSRLIAAVQQVYARGGIVGGGSAGLAIQGAVVFDSVAADRVWHDEKDVGTKDAVQNPFEPAISFTTHFFAWPPLRDAITDSHFARRNRFGRLAAFMARSLHDGLVTGHTVTGVAVDEDAVLLIDRRGVATLYQRAREPSGYVPRGAWIITGEKPQRLEPGRPLRYTISVTHLARSGDRYDLLHHRGSEPSYVITVDGSRRPIYQPANPYR